MMPTGESNGKWKYGTAGRGKKKRVREVARQDEARRDQTRKAVKARWGEIGCEEIIKIKYKMK